TARTTSDTVAQRAISAGRRSIMAFHTRRDSSNPAAPGNSSSPEKPDSSASIWVACRVVIASPFRSVARDRVIRQARGVHQAYVGTGLDVGRRGREGEATRTDLHHERIRARAVDRDGADHAHALVWNAVVAERARGRERELRGLTDRERPEVEVHAGS